MTESTSTRAWGLCVCTHGPNGHEAVILRPICIDPGNRVLFEGTLGHCCDCDCEMFHAVCYVEAVR
jgi:hypothetical protein